MNKQISDALRLILKVGGTVLATSGFLPTQCSITDPTVAQIAGVVAVLGGAVWGQISASRHQQLKEQANATI